MAEPTYSSALSAKAALLDETLAVLREIDRGYSVSQVQAMVQDADLLGKTTTRTRESTWESIHARYLSDARNAQLLARMVVHAPDLQTQRLVLFYELCRSSAILQDTTIRYVYGRYAEGYTRIDKTDLQSYFDSIVTDHPELASWSPQTRDKVASNILTILRDFGLLEGLQQKQFARVYVPLPAFVYVLYRLADDGLRTAQELLASDDWRLYFLETEDLLAMLDEATAANHCTFKHRGEVYSLDLHYPSLEGCVEALVAEV
jgi:hypothetical protein